MYPRPPPIPPPPRQSFSGASSNSNVPPRGYGPPFHQPRPPHPRANTAPSVFYPTHQQPTALPYPQPPPIPPIRSTPVLPASLVPGKRRDNGQNISTRDNALFFHSPSTQPAPSAFSTRPAASFYNESVMRVQVGPLDPSVPRPILPPKPFATRSDHVVQGTDSTGLTDFTFPPQTIQPVVPQKYVLPSSNPSVSNSVSLGKLPASSSDEDLARALADSLNVSSNCHNLQEEEDEVLARVLQESLKASERRSTVSYVGQPGSSSSSRQITSPSNGIALASNDRGNTNTQLADYAVSNSRMSDEERRLQMERDSQLARELALQEEFTPIATSPSLSNNVQVQETSQPPQADASDLPDYETAIQSSSGPRCGTVPITNPVSSMENNVSAPSPIHNPSSRPLQSSPHNQTSELQTTHVRTIVQSDDAIHRPNLGRSQTAQAALPTLVPFNGNSENRDRQRASSHSPSSARPTSSPPVGIRRTVSANPAPDLTASPRPVSLAPKHTTFPSPRMNQIPEDVNGDENRAVPDSPQPSASPSNATGLVEEDLIMGVSMGFTAPSISAALSPMQGPIPNIMSLPYGKCPALHIQAPSWKQLLKLLARMGESRIEPTVEAVAATKQQLQLRVVVQFVKVHHSSNEWRTIIYLTIDHPVPPAMPNAYKFTNGDVNMLPWSYTLSQLPALLRDGADTPMSKYYTIPVTDTLPYPNLPVRLDNLARYLQAALVVSRKAMNDSSSALRKLAKLVDEFYPSEPIESSVIGEDDVEQDRMRMGTGFIRRAFGFGGRRESRGGNANRDTFDLITPYRLDDYG